MVAEATLVRISRVSVKKLFGLYDHVIDLKVDERVTIIHGPNGVGKTMMLKLLSALFAGRFEAFTRVPFDRFEVQLTDSTVISVEPRVGGKAELATDPLAHRSNAPLRLVVAVLGSKTRKADVGADDDNHQLTLPEQWGGTPETIRQALAQWADPESLGVRDVAAFMERRGRASLSEPKWFVPIRSRVSLHVIEAQRLLRLPTEGSRRSRSGMVPTVRDYAQEFRKLVNETLARYASESQSLDQSFPQRLLRASGAELSVEDIKARMTDLDRKRARLKGIGLLDDNAASPFDMATLNNLDPTRRSVMTLYVEDTRKKLGVLDDLARRAELLRDNVNGKFAHKSLKINLEHGFTAIGHDGRPLDLDALSSGEQHELVLLYDLLFRVPPNTLVLIDEPELSLHVLWQKRFLPDLLEIVQTVSCDALIATHSPFIVGDRSDLMVPLAAELE
jgi:predicted ATPase